MSKPAQITVRRLYTEDAALLSRLARDSFYDTFTGTCTEEDMASFLEQCYAVGVLETQLSDPNDFYFLARLDDQPAGYVRFLENPLPSELTLPEGARALELNRLYVDFAFHGKGIGRALMGVYYDYARRHGYNYLWLGVWEFNFRAQRFYEREGFHYSGAGHPFPIGNTPQTDQWWVKAF